MDFSFVLLSANGVSSVASDVITVVILALLTIVSFGALIVFLCKYQARKSDEAVSKKTAASVLAVILAVGFVIRLIFALCIRGYREDYRLFTAMIEYIDANGLKGYYTGDLSATLYPLTFFIYLIFGGFANVTGIADFELGMQFTVKLPLIIAELLAAYCVYRLCAKYSNKYIGFALCAFVCVCPVFIIGSSVWATPLVITAMLACYACYFLARKKFAAAIAFATAAVFTSKEGIYLFPVFVVFGVYNIVKAAIGIKRDAPTGKALLSVDYNAVYTVPVSFIFSVTASYLLGLTMYSSYSCNFFKYINEFTLKPFVDWTFFTYNGLAVYSLFGMNGTEAPARFPAWVIAGVIAVIVTAAVCVVYFTRKNRATLVMLAAYVMFTMQVYFPGSSAIGQASALILIVAAYALVRDKRLLTVLFVTGLAFVINAGSVLANAGYLNNIVDYFFTADEYTGSTLLQGGVSAVNIVCSVLAVLSHLYFTTVAVGVGMTGQIKALGHADGIGGSLKEYFSIKKAE